MMFDGIKALSSDDLKKMQGLINAELNQRQEKRKKELWNNVLRAMKEYCAEFSYFEISCGECGRSFEVEFDCYESKDAGELTIITEEEWEW